MPMSVLLAGSFLLLKPTDTFWYSLPYGPRLIPGPGPAAPRAQPMLWAW